MRKLVAVEFLSLDGVYQAPGHPEEDREGGFEHGGWQMQYADDLFMQKAIQGMQETDANLFGRKTYEIMAAYWPNAPADDPFAKHLNSVRKYVASRTLKELTWQNSTLLEGDVPTAVAELKEQPGMTITILGSGELVRSLMASDLIDEYQLIVSPIVVGSGKKLFGAADQVKKLALVDAVTTRTGSQLLSYRPER
jgi:dihydrofolate reductase